MSSDGEHERPAYPRVGLGSAPIGDLYGKVPETQAIETIHAALQSGMSLIDTAPWYGLGLAEERVGLALRSVPRNTYQISTKVGRVLENGTAHFDFSRDGILRAFEASLDRLGVERLDVGLIHDPDDHVAQALDEALPTLINLKSQGLVGAVGVGMNDSAAMPRFINEGCDTVLLAGRYTLIEQGALNFLNFAAQRSIPVLLGGVFNSGVLATGPKADAKYNYIPASPEVLEKARLLARLCSRYEVPLPAVAMQFCVTHPAVATLVVGCASPSEVRANARNINTHIPEELWIALKEQALIDPASCTPGLII